MNLGKFDRELNGSWFFNPVVFFATGYYINRMTATTKFDWLSELSPAFAARDSWENGTYNDQISCQLTYPTPGPFYIACGIGLLGEHIRRFRFSPEVIQRLGQVTDRSGRSVLSESFLNYLQRLHLTVLVQAAPEGTLLLPGEPLLWVKGPKLQVLLMESALRILCMESTHWATQAALNRWKSRDWVEDDTPALPPVAFEPSGWRTRAAYIGGANLQQPEETPWKGAGEALMSPMLTHQDKPLVQIRRHFKGSQPLADVWLTQSQEEAASLSRTETVFTPAGTNQVQQIKFTRFQNLYQPALVKGHPVLAAPRPGYFRQRTLKQMEAFSQNGLENYQAGWYAGG